MPDFCGSDPVFTSISRVGVRPSLRDRRLDRVSQFRPVERLDHVGDPHRVPRLVGLQPADDVQTKIVFAAAVPEIAGRLLHAVLAEHHLSSGQGSNDRLGRFGL